MNHFSEKSPQPVEFSLDQCIKCNICVTNCPVAGVTDSYPGPKYEAPQAGRFRMGLRLAAQPAPDLSVDYCSGCRVCNMVCPTGVKIAEMNARARAALVQQGKVPLRLRLRNNIVARAELLGQVAGPVAPLANFALKLPIARQAMELMMDIHHHAPLPAFSSEKFRTWFRRRRPAPAASAQQEVRKVAYFHGCSTQHYEPRVGKAAVYVLETNGFEVLLPRQNCCGLPLLSNGELAAARRYHTTNVHHLDEYARQGIPIVGTSTSCTLTLKEEAPELLDMHDEATRRVAENTYDFNEFLVILLEQGRLRAENLRPIPLRLGYHIPCQYRAHRIGKPGLDILALIPQLEVVDSQAACCGIAGTYGYKKEKYAIAMSVGQPLFDFVRAINAPLVVCDSETCRWQITHATGIPAIHPVELLAVAYGFTPEGALAKVLAEKNIL